MPSTTHSTAIAPMPRAVMPGRLESLREADTGAPPNGRTAAAVSATPGELGEVPGRTSIPRSSRFSSWSVGRPLGSPRSGENVGSRWVLGGSAEPRGTPSKTMSSGRDFGDSPMTVAASAVVLHASRSAMTSAIEAGRSSGRFAIIRR